MTDWNPRLLSDYEKGYIVGLEAFSWWKDGSRYVGTTGTTFRTAVIRFLTSRGWPDEEAEAIARMS